MDIKAIIEQTGHKVFIINALNGGMEYQDLSLQLRAKGGNVSPMDLHKYHTTLKNYDTAQQVKPYKSSEGETDVSKAILNELIEMDTIAKTNALQGLKMLRSLFFRQLAICHNLQSEFLNDDMVIINNELKNLVSIKVMYYDAVKIGFDKFIALDGYLEYDRVTTTTD